MRIRTIKPEWLEDEKMMESSIAARLMSVALLLLADDHGRGRGSITYLHRMAMPREAPDVVQRARDELVAMGFIVLYRVRDQEYFEVRNWSKHQRVDRPGKPRVPEPPTNPREDPPRLTRESRETHAKDRETHAKDRETEETNENAGSRDTRVGHEKIRGSHATDHDHDHDHRPTTDDRRSEARAPAPAREAPTEPDLSVDPNQTAIANHIRSRPELAEVILDIDGIASDIVGHFMGLRPLPMREVCEAIDRAWKRVRAAKRSSTPATPREAAEWVTDWACDPGDPKKRTRDGGSRPQPPLADRGRPIQARFGPAQKPGNVLDFSNRPLNRKPA